MDASIEARAWTQFEEQIEGWLREGETEEVLRKAATEQPLLTVGAVRAAVIARWDELKELLDTPLKAWEKASRKLAKAEQSVEERIPRSRLRIAGILTLIGLAAATAGAIWLGINVSPTYFLILYVMWIIPAYWFDLREQRGQARTEFSVSIRALAVERAEDRFRAALSDQVAVCIRETINFSLRSFDKTFRLFDQRGLRELADPEREVSTRSSRSLSELLLSLDSGSIGLAGPRGAGKTTLIQSFAQGRSVPFEKERVGLVVSAPVKYNAREFVLHLFGSLCRQVVGESDLEEAQHLGKLSLERRRRAHTAGFAVLAGVLLMVAGMAMVASRQTAPEGPLQTGLSLLVVGFLLFYVGLLVRTVNDRRFARRVARIFTLGRGRKKRDTIRRALTPEQVALERLEEIGYQQSLSSGWSQGMNLPFGLSLEGDSTMTSARNPWSLPEAVEEFRRFTSSQFKGRYVVIGIDELDKMESDKAAREFLNDVKGVFGVRNCYYLVSVSEDAMSTFERRGLPFRDVFDSSFDAMQLVGYLTLAESCTLLESRVTGLPVPFQCLCHALAGGLPRDLIRVTRDLVQRGSPTTTLSDLALELIRTEHRGKMAAAISAVRGAPWPQRNWLVDWLTRQNSDQATSTDLQKWSLELNTTNLFFEEDTDNETVQQCKDVALQVVAFNYFGATVVEFFDLKEVDRILCHPHRNELDPIGAFPVETLAVARQQFGISPSLSWATLSRVRKMTEIPSWPIPDPLIRVGAG